MTVREFLNNNEISLDDEIIVNVSTGDYDEEGYISTQDFRITSRYKTYNNKIALCSTELDTYINDFIM